MRLEEYINQLLFQYDCVIVPKFGAFITYPVPSSINKEDSIINPPYKDIKFSATITNDDGVLTQAYVLNENISLERATSFLEDDVKQWKLLLNAGEKIVLQKIGILYKDDKGELVFKSHTTENFLAYGLSSLKPNVILPQNLEVIVKEQKRNWSALLAVASIIPIVVGGYFYFNTPQPVQKFVDHQWSGIVLPAIREAAPNLLNAENTPVTNEVETIHNLPTTINNPAEFIKQQNPVDTIKENIVSKYEVTVVEEKQINDSEKEVKAIIKNTKGEAATPIVQTKAEEPKTKVVKEEKKEDKKEEKKESSLKIDANPKKYQIIAASLRREEDAARMLQSLEKDGFKNAKVVYSKGYYYYVTYDGFNDKEAATKYLNNLHKNHPDAWIREEKAK